MAELGERAELARIRAARGRSATGVVEERDRSRRAGARDLARGGPSAPFAPGLPDGDPGPLRAFPDGRPRHHARASRRARRAAGIKGVVADIMRPPPELETAVEAVLGERLGNVIVESHEAGVEAIQFLKQRERGALVVHSAGAAVAGRGAVVYDATCGRRRSTTPAAPASRPARRRHGASASAGRRRGRARPDARAHRLRPSVRRGRGLPARRRAGGRGPGSALALWRETRTDKTIVTLDGEVIDPQGVVTGGSRESAVAGVLSRSARSASSRRWWPASTPTSRRRWRATWPEAGAAECDAMLEEIRRPCASDEMALYGRREGSRRRRCGMASLGVDGRSSQRSGRAPTSRERERCAPSKRPRLGSRPTGRWCGAAEARAAELRERAMALAEEVDAAVAG